ncbi:MAG: CoA transferase, partial [Acidobacteriota bacterium]
TAPRDHWLERAAELPVSPVLTLAEAVAATGAPATLAFLGGGGASPAGPAPALGEHTALVLAELGDRSAR